MRLTTAEAAARLGVKPATLYAYVSRGVLTRQRSAAGSTFDPAEVERLAAGSRRGRSRSGGGPQFVSGLTLIEAGRLSYRGLDAVAASREHGFEEVAGWLWHGEWPGPGAPWVASGPVVAAARSACGSLDARCPPADRWRVAVAAAATADPLRHDRSPAAVAATAQGLVATLVDVADVVARRPGPVARTTVAARLWPRISQVPPTDAQVDALDAALVLLADHELAASTLAVRAAASFGADPYAAVLAGMAASSGPRHAASSLQVRPVLARAAAQGAAVAVGEVLGRDGVLHGFGHPLYPDGDPRAVELLDRLRHLPGGLAATEEVIDLAARRGMPPANVDLALAAMAEQALMVPGASEAVFVLGRIAGWVAHAMEEYAERTPFRARAAYVGPRPGDRPN